MDHSIFNKILVITGPTASGKSYLAEQLLNSYSSAAVVNADSMQVYKDLPILSGQPDIQEKPDSYELYGFLDFYENCSVGIWLDHAHKVIKKIFKKEKLPVIVGGTGLYIKALFEGIANIPDIENDIYKNVQKEFQKLGKESFHAQLNIVDPVSAKNIHQNDTYRMQRAMAVYKQTGRSINEFRASIYPYYDVVHISILPNRDTLYGNCNSRFRKMLDNGAEQEAELLFKKIQDRPSKYNIENTFGYRNIVACLKGEIDLERAIIKATQATRNYAKRQYTWFNNQFSNKIILSYDSEIKEIQQKFFDVIYDKIC